MTYDEAKNLLDELLKQCGNSEIRGGYFTLIYNDGTRTSRYFTSKIDDRDLIWKMTMAGVSNTYSMQKFQEEFPLKSQIEMEMLK